MGMLSIRQAILVRPEPLIDPVSKLIVLYSAKSACTNVMAWFWHRIGLGKEADARGNPRHYRLKYFNSDRYRSALDDDLTTYVVVRVIRDPIERAASSFRHAVKSGYADEDLQRVLGRTVRGGFSFTEFVDYLERIDLDDTNIHQAKQWHPIEGLLAVRHLINITTQHLLTRLNEIEATEGWPVTDFNAVPWIARSERRRKRRVPSSVVLTPETRSRLAKVYADDIARYTLRP
jgi:hypothetical protein